MVVGMYEKSNMVGIRFASICFLCASPRFSERKDEIILNFDRHFIPLHTQ
jgi:hypothetical protein